jgi:hypothetical protein
LPLTDRNGLMRKGVSNSSLAVMALAAALLCLAGCAAKKSSKTQTASNAAAPAGQESGAEALESPAAQATPAPPTATVHIEYAHRNDYLQSLKVSKFSSASVILTHPDKRGTASVVRFDGGEPVWEIEADKGLSGSLLGHMPGVDENRKYAITSVTYGTVPKHFVKVEPENSDPEPLESGKYYIFTVHRAVGATSYQAVRVGDDGAIEAYAAQPRAGTSYELCCNIAPDFTISASSGPLGTDQLDGP